MPHATTGPNDAAWGVTLTDPVTVTHQGKQIVFARPAKAVTDTLYFRVLDPSETTDGAAYASWTGWFRTPLPQATTRPAHNVRAGEEGPAAERRIAGMELLTVAEFTATTTSPADAAFRVISDGTELVLFRPSTSGTLYVDTFVLVESTEQEGDEQSATYDLQVAWEVRFRRSGHRDVPLNDTDGPGYRDAEGTPFLTPTVELTGLGAMRGGLFDLAVVPTSDSETSWVYVLAAVTDGFQLTALSMTRDAGRTFASTVNSYTAFTPTLAGTGGAVTPLAGLAPALGFYGEQETVATPDGQSSTDLPRAARLVCALPVTAAGLPAAMAIIDFAVDHRGRVADLASSEQVLPLVDGTVTDGVFQPDTTATRYPDASNVAPTLKLVDGLAVMAMVLGQIQPHSSPAFGPTDDGLVHLYFGGPLPSGSGAGFDNLDPDLPQAMVAQCDASVGRTAITLPWQVRGASETGVVSLRARLAGSLMNGMTAVVSDSVDAGVCTLAVTYPPATGLPKETWTAMPRDLGSFMTVLGGGGSDDSADPRVLNGEVPFFDFGGTHPIVRVPLTPAPPTGAPPTLTFVSTRADLPLASADVSPGQVKLTFTAPAGSATITWPQLPANLGAARDIFDGVADPGTYAYPSTASDSRLYALPTDAIGVDAPLVMFQTDAAKPSYTLAVTPDPSDSTKLQLTVTGAAEPDVFGSLPRAVDAFASALAAAPAFSATGLAVSSSGAAGNVRVTPAAVAAMGLADTCVLFDVLLSAADPQSMSMEPGTVVACTQSHTIAGNGTYDLDQAIGVYATSPAPEDDLVALVQTSSSTPSHVEVDDIGWIRQPTQRACALDGTQTLSVPLVANGSPIPNAENLAPQRNWTVESWLKPARADRQRLLSYNDASAALSPVEPVRDFVLDTEGQEVMEFALANPPVGVGASTFLQTHSSSQVGQLPGDALTVEMWAQPDATAALGPLPSGTTRYGGLVQVGNPNVGAPLLSVLLTMDRKLVIQTCDSTNTVTYHDTGATLPAVDANSVPVWSHVAAVLQADGNGTFTLTVYVDGSRQLQTTAVPIGSQSEPLVTIGRQYQLDSTFFGRLAQVRCWRVARSGADLRRTWRTALSGDEPGLLGNWTLAGLSAGQPPFAANNADVTGTDWDAPINASPSQQYASPRDSFFLSLIASVGGVAPQEFDARLATNEWNHIAVVFEVGGALELNPPARLAAGLGDWAVCIEPSALTPPDKFGVDAWVKIPVGSDSDEVGTIIGQWAPKELDDERGFRVFVTSTGELAASLIAISDLDGTRTPVEVSSDGWKLRDGAAHHVAITVETSDADDGRAVAATVTVTLYKDNGTPVVKQVTIPGHTAQLQAGAAAVTVGCSYPPLDGESTQADIDTALFQGLIGRLRLWASTPSAAQLFPEDQRHSPRYGGERGLVARWNFTEGAGRVCADDVGDNDLKLNSSRPWATLPETGSMAAVANGSLVGVTTPATPGAAITPRQFSIGLPEGWTGANSGLGFDGEVGRIALYGSARTAEEIRSQRFGLLSGNEPDLLACWSFTDGTTDITGAGNDISPPPAPTQLRDANVPIGNESPVVRNVYGGDVTNYSSSTTGLIAVGSYAVVRRFGTDAQHAVVVRDYVLDALAIPDTGVQIGVLGLVYLGQVQTDPTLIGFIEGAPPVPSENLTRPYYLSPGSPGYMKYLDTSMVTLVQEAGTTLSYSSSSAHVTGVNFDAALGGAGARTVQSTLIGVVVFETTKFQLAIQGRMNVQGQWGDSSSEALAGAWTATQRSAVGFSGGWEPYEKKPGDYFNPQVGRRFVPDNLGYALVESLTADQYAMVLGRTGSAIGIITVPNPTIPPDRNVLMFPMDSGYTLAGSLDGKIGLRNAECYSDADVRRRSYFDPVDAYAAADRIERSREQALSAWEQRNVKSRAHGWDSGIRDVQSSLPATFDEEPEGPVAVALPIQGLVNRYVWTADGGLYSETHASKADSTRSFTGMRGRGGAGGFHAEGQHAMFGGNFIWALDLMVSHRVDLTLEKSEEESQTMSLDVSVEGEAFLSSFVPTGEWHYGGEGTYSDGAAPGKVRSYRFMTIYEPPTMDNSAAFETIIDPNWLAQSNMPNARALRQAKLANPVWRVRHRVTYVERIPPPISSRPATVIEAALREPTNFAANAQLVALVLSQVPHGTPLDPAALSEAVGKAINPPPDGSGAYPKSALELIAPWWGTFLTSARPAVDGTPPDPAAASALRNITRQTNSYLKAALLTGLISTKASQKR